jgi:DNA-binding MarR family transcriptional regulator
VSGNPEQIGEVLFALATLSVRQRPRDLSLTALSTLATIERSGARRLTDLAAGEGVTQPSMSSLVSQLERLGLAERRADPGDGRVVRVAITPAGRRHMDRLRRAEASMFEALIARLGPKNSAALRAALPALRRVLELAEKELPAGRSTA